MFTFPLFTTHPFARSPARMTTLRKFHIARSLAVISEDVDQAKRRHPASWSKDDDPHPVKEHSGEGWRRLWHNVILFDRREAG
jgi:hypothetical protein